MATTVAVSPCGGTSGVATTVATGRVFAGDITSAATTNTAIADSFNTVSTLPVVAPSRTPSTLSSVRMTINAIAMDRACSGAQPINMAR